MGSTGLDRAGLGWATLCVAAAATSLTGQQPSFRAGIESVRLDVHVVDAQGRFVPDLTKDDFTVIEDGREQTISTFSVVNLPMARPAPLTSRVPLVADVATNASSRDGRIYVLVLDDLHIHDLRAVTVRQIAEEFIDRHVMENDRVAVATTSGTFSTAQEFTSDRARLLNAIEHFGPRTVPAPDGPNLSSGYPERVALESLRSILRWLSTIPDSRKSVILVSEGLPIEASQLQPLFVSLDTPPRIPTSEVAVLTVEAITAAAQANVAIYAIDPRGLPTAPASTIKPVPELADENRIDSQIASGRQTLTILSEETGGAALIHSNDFTATFDRIVSDASNYYLIGYSPLNSRRDRKLHRIRVTTRRPGLTAQTRRGYAHEDIPDVSRRTATPGAMPAALGRAFQSPVPVTGVNLTTTAAAFRGSGSRASVTVVVEASGAEAPLTPDQRAVTGHVDLFLAAATDDGKVKASDRGTLELRLPPSDHPERRDRGVRLVTTLNLSPGRYHLRVAALQADINASGSVLHDFEVPNFSKNELSMSNLLLTSASADGVPTGGPPTRWRRQLQWPPTANRTFSMSDELVVFGEIYVNRTGSAPTVTVSTRIEDETGAAKFQGEDSLNVDVVRGKPQPAAHLVSIPVKTLGPGHYVLSVEASDRERKEAVTRQVSFTVVP